MNMKIFYFQVEARFFDFKKKYRSDSTIFKKLRQRYYFQKVKAKRV